MVRSLSISDHRRDSAGLTYVYPVVSRRAGGVSVGINFNPNNACNWRCIYCQVPNLRRGSAPPPDLDRLTRELDCLLRQILDGTFYQRFRVPPGQRTLRDVAVSGNGEPTSLRQFDAAIAAIETTLAAVPLPAQTARVIISNGSLVHRPAVQRGLDRWRAMGGELWFKLDRATPEGLRRINRTPITPERILANLGTAARICPVWIQTCLFTLDGHLPSEGEQRAYLDFLTAARTAAIPLRGVLLYGLARPPMQPEANRLDPVPAAWMEAFAERIRTLGLAVKLTP